MFLWFIGTAVIAVWYVFRDDRFDYRLLVVGALLPELDALFGGMRWMHSLAFSVALLIGVMAVSVAPVATAQDLQIHAAPRAGDRLLLALGLRRRVGDHGRVLVAVHRGVDRRRTTARGAARMVESAAGGDRSDHRRVGVATSRSR